MRKGRTFAFAAALLLLLLLVAGGWWFGSPWWTLWRMREAAQARDSEALAAYVDFPALRASTRRQLRLGPVGALLAGPAVDALVSPEALALALGSAPRPKDGGQAGGGRSGESGTEGIAPVRSGASEFKVERDGRTLIFRRHGLRWKLEEIRLSSRR